MQLATDTAASDVSKVISPRERIRMRDPLFADVLEFLYEEAEVLDQDDFESWLGLLSDDLRYVMPTRATVHRADGKGFFGQMAHFDEDYTSMLLRLRRVRETKSAWAEDPPSRARRFVTNVRAWRTEDPTQVEVSSYLLLTRSRGDSPTLELLTAERRDTIRNTADQWLLARREILVDQSTLGMVNMALFL